MFCALFALANSIFGGRCNIVNRKTVAEINDIPRSKDRCIYIWGVRMILNKVITTYYVTREYYTIYIVEIDIPTNV